MINRIKRILNRKNIEKTLSVSKMTFLGHTAKYPPEVILFENSFAKYMKSKYALSFCNATSSFEASLFALGLKKGDRVIASSMTFYSIVNSMLHYGLDITFVDINENLEMLNFEENINKNIKLIVVSHLFGIPKNMNYILKQANQNNIKIIEDCSHGHGAIYKNKRVGTIGDIGFFSLQGDKAVSGGEAGIVITNKKLYYDKMRLYSHMGREMSDINFDNNLKATGLGKKGRMHPLAAGLASVELKYLDKYNFSINKNILILNIIIDNFKNINYIEVDKDIIMGGFYYGYPIWIENNYDINILIKYKKIIRKYPYPIYHKNKYFINSNNFYEKVYLEIEKDYESNVVLKKTEKAKDKLLFIAYEFIENLSSKDEEILKKIFASLNV